MDTQATNHKQIYAFGDYVAAVAPVCDTGHNEDEANCARGCLQRHLQVWRQRRLKKPETQLVSQQRQQAATCTAFE